MSSKTGMPRQDTSMKKFHGSEGKDVEPGIPLPIFPTNKKENNI